MIKRIAFIQRHPSLSREVFHARWGDEYAKLFVANPALADQLLRYEQHQRTPRDYERSECLYDGVEIQWWRSIDALSESATDPLQTPIREAATSLFVTDNTLEVFTEPAREVIEGPVRLPDTATKLICGVRRKAHMNIDDFHRYWWEVHGPINRDTPAVAKYLLRYEQNHRLTKDYERTQCDLDGVTVEWFASARDFFGMAVDPESRDTIRADENNFLDTEHLVWLLAKEERLVLDRF